MKTLTALLFLCVFSTTLPAQKVKSGFHPDEIKNSIFQKKLSLTPAKHGNYKVQESSFSAKQKLDSIVSESFNYDLSIWQNESKEAITYSSKGKQLLYVFSDWDIDKQEWTGYLKEESGYDSDGNHTLFVIYLWDSSSGMWLGMLKTEYIYENGLIKYEEAFSREAITDDWESFGVSTYEYFEGLLVSIIHGGIDSNYDGEINELDETKIGYFYDPQGNLIREITYLYPDEQTGWLAVEKTEYTYTSENKVETETSYSNTDWESTEWLPGYQGFFSYDSNGNRISETSSYWDYNINSWQVSDRWEYNFNVTGDLVSMVLYFWDDESESLMANIKNEYTHDDSFSYEELILPYDYPPEFFRHMIKTYNQYEFIDGDWIIATRGEIFYSDFNSSGIPEITIPAFTVFPNPATGSVIFKGNFIPGKTSIELFDFTGRIVKSDILPENGQISVDHLKGGIYFYKISSRGFTKTGKLIVK